MEMINASALFLLFAACLKALEKLRVVFESMRFIRKTEIVSFGSNYLSYELLSSKPLNFFKTVLMREIL